MKVSRLIESSVDLIILISLILYALSMFDDGYTSRELLFSLILVIAPLTVIKVICRHYFNHSTNILSIVICSVYLLIAGLGLAMYVFAFIYPDSMKPTLEYFIVPLYQILAVLCFSLTIQVIKVVVKTYNKPLKRD